MAAVEYVCRICRQITLLEDCWLTFPRSGFAICFRCYHREIEDTRERGESLELLWRE